MILACIDIGSNTTRLLVADADGRSLRELLAERAFTRIGASMAGGGPIPHAKVNETATVVSEQAARAREAGARAVAAVATAAIREASNRDELVEAVRAQLGSPLRVLDGHEEARLSFLGASRTLPEPATGQLAVVDVGGGSTEIAVGAAEGSMEWCRSLRVGSGLLADAHLRSDPPSAGELDAVRAAVAAAFDGVRPPAAQSAVAVGGTATSLWRLAGGELDHQTLEQAVGVLASRPIAEVAQSFELDPQRVRLLPAGILLLQAVSDCLELPLRIARGGLREGVILELAAG